MTDMTTMAPRTFDEAVTFSSYMAKSSLVPSDYRGKPENVLVAIQMGHEIGLQPMQALQNIAVINGRPSIYGDAALAICKAHKSFGGIKEWIEGEGESMTAHCIVERIGQPEVRVSFGVERAKRAGLWGKQGPWTNYPERMMQMRARSFALRDQFPDALRGMILAEEAQDIPEEKVVEDVGQKMVAIMEEPEEQPKQDARLAAALSGEVEEIVVDDALLDDFISDLQKIGNTDEMQEFFSRVEQSALSDGQKEKLRPATAQKMKLLMTTDEDSE